MITKRRQLVYSIALLATLGWAVPGAVAAPKLDAGLANWRISDARLVDPGQTTVTPEGTLTSGYIVEARARGAAGTLLPDGRFRIVASSFSPSSEMPGQQVGLWYLRAQWSIADRQASRAAQQARHSHARIQGRMRAELPFNPLVEQGDFLAEVSLPNAPAAGRWARGQGTFSGNSLFEGSIVLDVLLGLEQ